MDALIYMSDALIYMSDMLSQIRIAKGIVWIAEGIVEEEDKPMSLETSLEMTANKYLDQLTSLAPMSIITLTSLRAFMKSTRFKDLSVDKQQAIIKSFRLTAPKVAKLISEIIKSFRLTAPKIAKLISEINGDASRKQSSSRRNDLVRELISLGINFVRKYKYPIEELICRMFVEVRQYAGGQRFEILALVPSYDRVVLEELLNNFDILMSTTVENIESMLLKGEDISIGENLSETFFFKKAFPTYVNMQNDHERCMSFIFLLTNDLLLPTYFIFRSWHKQPLALALIGGLLSLKPMTLNIWNRVKDDLEKIKGRRDDNVTTDHMGQIFTYCYNDLPYFLQPCFLYFSCYPIGFEIPATSLTQIWIAEGIVEEEDKHTSLETTANKYLDELVQRSLVFVSKRSLLGTIKSCRLPRSIHEFVIKQSYEEGFSVVNPNQEDVESVIRLAINQDNKKQCTEVKNILICFFLAFKFDGNVLGGVNFLRVLALRNSTISVTTLTNKIYLRYLSLRGCNISELPENIGDMKNLQTLDVRDTSIAILPDSLWNIKTLRHVYVKPSSQIKGPPSEAHIDNLHTLKIVAAHESWLKKLPHFLIHLRKLALSNWDNLDWKSISNLLSHMDRLISMAIMGNIIPSEFADTRAFRNLETVKSIKLEGEWICRKLLIDNIKFPPNLTKLTLTKSRLKEDPMPTLERLQALKFLRLQDEAYIGNQMVCSANGFPQLQLLKLENLENLENWEVKPAAMSQLRELSVVQCQKLISNHPDLRNHPNLNHVTDKVID